jgi:hypothetical protein
VFRIRPFLSDAPHNGRLKVRHLLGFLQLMTFIRDMTGPISPGNAAAQYSIAVAEKQLSAQKEQGQQAVQLIQSATPAEPPSGTGKHVNLRA